MEKQNWFLRLSKWSWTPIILGAIVCFAGVAINRADAVEAIPAGVGLVAFGWLAMIKGFAA